ncbi:MAG: UDP-N-acetylmuramate:L-alanyl-gamma-D-glutamyl-meso-diaminopimelate ligase [Methylococcaceae bacterium]|nr:UDP-N-acetylmuramate:L-alanyl-gamma-D-glutamyl-meso-diaminopimelate ligase [Methylococcaceae bacterium]
MHIHILGICGTFMGGLALIARELGHTVSGSDQNVYPPMSTQLTEQGIQLMQGYSAENLAIKPDLVVVGNALSRGNPEVEAVLNLGLKYTSGPQWLSEYVLQDKWVLAVAGTHGKTTTSSMLAWILEYQGFKPGFLIGGIPMNFGLSARAGETDFFVIEADEYDSAFFDKRSKFVHYRPRTAILNNLEFDHADIFDDLSAIKRQFHHLVRTIPGQGLIIAPKTDVNVQDTLAMGCWTPVQQTAIGQQAEWQVELVKEDGSQFKVLFADEEQGEVNWGLTGLHNVQNGLAAIAAARHIGILPVNAIAALAQFKNVKRRMEVIANIRGTTVYDDFAHHPTAIKMTLEGLRKHVGAEKIIAVVEPRSNTMRMGVHRKELADALSLADRTIVYQPENLAWDLTELKDYADNIQICISITEIMAELQQEVAAESHFLMMSNGSFDGIYQRIKNELK